MTFPFCATPPADQQGKRQWQCWWKEKGRNRKFAFNFNVHFNSLLSKWVVTLQWNIFYPMIFYRKYCEWPLRLKRFIIYQGPVFHFRLGQIYRKLQDSKGRIESWWDLKKWRSQPVLCPGCVHLHSNMAAWQWNGKSPLSMRKVIFPASVSAGVHRVQPAAGSKRGKVDKGSVVCLECGPVNGGHFCTQHPLLCIFHASS